MQPGTHEKSIPNLVRELLDDAGELVRDEVRLARAEAEESLAQLGRSLVPIAVGAGLGLAALVMALSALNRGLTALLAQVLPLAVAVWLAPLLLAVALGIAAWIFVDKGRTAIQRLRLVPVRTRETLREDKEWITSKLS